MGKMNTSYVKQTTPGRKMSTQVHLWVLNEQKNITQLNTPKTFQKGLSPVIKHK